MTEPRTPDYILHDFRTTTDLSVQLDLIHEIIEDVNSSWVLALESLVPTDGGDDIIRYAKIEVEDYVGNHY
jgi:hypothetical protein